MTTPFRFGILGAAWIAPAALIKPARRVGGVEIAAIAARDAARAQAFATKHGIPRVIEGYEKLLASDAIDAVYLPLPNALHCAWAIRALEAGKHVLVEKPLASNADEAERMAEAATRAGRVLAEAMHWRYHPIAARIDALCRGGELGALRHVEIINCFPIFRSTDIRYRYDLGGGGMMDLGCYAVSLLRLIAAAEPEVVFAEAKLATPNVDRWMTVHLRFPSGATATITCAIWSREFMKSEALVYGARGTLKISNPFAPNLFNSLLLKTATGKQKEQVKGDWTFDYQLRAFVAAAQGGPSALTGPPVLTGPAEAIANMRVIDAAYQKAGLPRRGEPALALV